METWVFMMLMMVLSCVIPGAIVFIATRNLPK